MYKTLRTIHLLCGAFALPYLAMYAISAVQMAHTGWFHIKPSVTERTVAVSARYDHGRRLALELMSSEGLRGEIQEVQTTPSGYSVRIAVPGTVHEIRYVRATGEARLKTSVAGVMGMLNRLHHAAGWWHEYLPLKLWALLVGIVSFAVLGLGATGLWMWWLRRQERTLGLILLAANLVFTAVVLTMIRAS